MKKLINGIDFGSVWAMSGFFNFYGQGWPYHKILKILGVDLKPITFVSKTVTLLAREGNMPLKKNLMPVELIPKSIYINFLHKPLWHWESFGKGFDFFVDSVFYFFLVFVLQNHKHHFCHAFAFLFFETTSRYRRSAKSNA